MICPSCTFENPEGLKFCGGCGRPIPNLCASCGFENPEGFNFCGKCGNHLETGALKPPPNPGKPTQITPATRAERRRITVMFCDMVGSTALSHKLDPEDLRIVVRKYQEVCEKEIAKYEGHIAQYLGDGILIYFGYPKAHENDAHRAVSSGLGILSAVTELNQQLQSSIGTSISIRIGIHTGLVVIGNIGDKEASQQLALGAAPNIAAKLESLAAPDSMVISSETFELISEHFKCKDLGKQKIKGVEKDLNVFQVISDLGALKRFEFHSSAQQLPLVGRDEEVQQLLKYWKEAKRGNSRTVMLSGEGGMGKSRVLQTMVEQIAHEEDLWLIPHQCSPYHRNTAFYPIVQTMKRLGLELKGEESPKEQLKLLEEFLAHFNLPVQELIPLFAGIMTISLADSKYHTPQFSIEQQKQKIISALLTLYMTRAKEKNVLLVFEDLHWMDDSSLEMISQLIQQSPQMNLLTILSFRPQFEPTWRLRSNVVMMPLSNLFDSAMKSIMNRIAKGKTLPESLVEQIIKKTDGVPLFVEELTKMVVNSDMVIEHEDHYELRGPLSSLAIPNTLHDSLLARLDTMNVARSVAQVGSVIGREFKYPLVLAASGMEETPLRSCLDQLVQAELLLQSGALPHATFTFRHALIRDAAYQSLLKTRQQQLHKTIAGIITEHYDQQVQDQPAIAAYHFEKGRMIEQAISHWLLAANKVRKHQAFEEALRYLQRAQELLPALSDDQERSVFELKVLSTQAPLYLMTAGWGSELTFKASSKLEKLAREQGDKLNLFRALHISTTCELFSGRISQAPVTGKKSLVIAKELGKPELIAEAYRIIGQTLLFGNDLIESSDSFSEAISTGQSSDLSDSDFAPSNPIVISHVQKSHVMWLLGYPDQAIAGANMAVREAEKRKLPYDLTICLFVSSFVNYWVGNLEQCSKYALECNRISETYGNNMFAFESVTYIGAAKVLKGEVEEGLGMIHSSIAKRDQRAKSGINLHTVCFAELCLKKGKIDAGLEAISRSLEQTEHTRERHFLSEIYRVKGDLLLAKDSEALQDEIEQCFQKSLAISREQSAKSLELRTAISIARLRKSQDRITDGLNLVKNIYSWFKEGFQTKDLLAAKSLIDELAFGAPANKEI